MAGVLIALSAASQTAAEEPQAVCADGEAISQAIAKAGPAAVFKGRFDNEEGWERLLSCIRSGNVAWLQVALQVQGRLDGGGSGELAMAVGDALERNPAGVLRLLRRG
jgi:CMP-2-keto-3-deoxyoctulosonic acid synthetase